MLYLPNTLTIDGTKINVWRGGVDTGAKGSWHPLGENTYQCDIVWPHHTVGETYCMVAAAVHYLRQTAGVSCRTSYLMWGSRNLFRILLRDGSLTLMNIASSMVLVMLCTSLPTMERLSILMWCPVVLPCLYMFEGTLRCSLSLSSKDLPDSPVYSSLQPVWCIWSYRLSHFIGDVILVLGGHQEVLGGILPIKCTWTPTLSQTFSHFALVSRFLLYGGANPHWHQCPPPSFHIYFDTIYGKYIW